MLIDDVKIRVIAGNGGKGAVMFNKNMMSLGPTGGNGGNGGNVYVEGISNLSGLNKFRFKKEFKAENGQNGLSQLRDGRNGDNLILLVPVGTVLHKLETKEDVEITKIGERILIAKGGKGGKGNFYFRSATNTTPIKFKYGKEGESLEVHFELKLIADVGFVGLPNVGKTSLLNELTNSKSKVANYSFTTLEPNLGVYYDLILADIPGLIEGASSGKGLGIKFLKHIERTKIIFHFIAANSIDPVSDYKILRNELGKYNKKLLEKPEYLFVSKKDLVSSSVISDAVKKFKKMNKDLTLISIYDSESLKFVKKILNDLISEKVENKE